MAKKGVNHISEIEQITGEKNDQVGEVKATANEEIADSLKKTEESKETFVKSLEFEPDTFKIDSTGWKEVTEADKDDPIFGQFVGKEPKVKVNATGDVVEYLEGSAEGEQIFIGYYAFIREVMRAKNCTEEELEAKYLMTVDEFGQKMADKPDTSEEYKKFFEQEIKGHLAGGWHPHNKIFYTIGDRSTMWLAGGFPAYFDSSKGKRFCTTRVYGLSGRLLKN